MTDMPEKLSVLLQIDGRLYIPEPGKTMSWGNKGYAQYIRADLVPSWRPIETAPTTPGDVHIRGCWVNSAVHGLRWWESYIGEINEFGEFVDCEHGDPLPFSADDFTHWMPKPQPPQEAQSDD